MDSEGRVIAFCAMLFAMFMLAVVGGCTYDSLENKKNQRVQIEQCLSNGGEWRLQQLDDDYAPDHVCVKPGADMGKRRD